MSFQICLSVWIPCILCFKSCAIKFTSGTYSYIAFIPFFCSWYSILKCGSSVDNSFVLRQGNNIPCICQFWAMQVCCSTFLTCVEIKCQLDVTEFLLQTLLLAQHVSGTTMTIIRSSRVLYGDCCLWYFVLWFSSCWSGVELRVMCPVCMMLQHPANRTHNPQLYTRPATWKPQHEIPQAATTV